MLSDLELAKHCQTSYNTITFGTDRVHLYVPKPNVIVFRGTASIQDWLRNLQVVPNYVEGLGMVHAGFYRDLLDAWNLLPNDLYDVTLTGHSKGGADALLMACMLKDAGYKVAKVTTFGSPPVGFRFAHSLCRYFNGVEGSDYRHADDPVPLCMSLYEHPRPLRQLGKVFQDLKIIEDHYIEGYIKCLTEYSKS